MALRSNSSSARTIDSVGRSAVFTDGTGHSHGPLVASDTDLSSRKRRDSSGEVLWLLERCLHRAEWESDDRYQPVLVEFPLLRIHSSDYLSSGSGSDSVSDVVVIHQLADAHRLSNSDAVLSFSNVCIQWNPLLPDEFSGYEFGFSRSRCDRRIRFVDDELPSEATARGIISATLQWWTNALRSAGSAQRSIPVGLERHCRLSATGEILHSSHRIENQCKSFLSI